MNDIWPISCPLEVGQSSYEGNDRIWVIGDTKVWPSGVVELFHLTSVVPSTHPERPYGVVGQLLNLDERHGKVTKVQAANLRPVLVTFSLHELTYIAYVHCICIYVHDREKKYANKMRCTCG